MGNSHSANTATATRLQRATPPPAHTASQRASALHLTPQVASAVRHAYRQAQRAQVYLDAVHAAIASTGGLARGGASDESSHTADTARLRELGELLLLPSPSASQRSQLDTLTREALAGRAGETPRGRASTSQMAQALHPQSDTFPASFARDALGLRTASAGLVRRMQTADRARTRVLALLPGSGT